MSQHQSIFDRALPTLRGLRGGYQKIAGQAMVTLCIILGIGLLHSTVSRAVQARTGESVGVPELLMTIETDVTTLTPVINPERQGLANEVETVSRKARSAETPAPSLTDHAIAARHVMPSAKPEMAPAMEAPAARVVWMEVTAYCACKKCCGPQAQGITASGKPVSYNNGVFVAADTRILPFGTKVRIPGYHGGKPVEVIDRGGAIKGHKIDVYYTSHARAKEWGRQWIPVEVMD